MLFRSGRLIYVTLQGVMGQRSKFFVIRLRPGTVLPSIPEGGFKSAAQLTALGARELSLRPGFVPGPDPETYAYTVTTSRGNLFRIPVP